MPRPSNTATTSRGVSATTTVLFLVILILAFFPSLFATVVRLPLSLLTRSTARTNPAIPPACTHCCNTPPPLPPSSAQSTMSWFQKTINLPAASKGSYLVTDHVLSALPEVKQYRVGLLNLFVQHTSCALSLNENWDEDVRADMTDALDRIVEEDKGSRKGLYRHDAEGSDDMPAHIKSALVGASVTIPIRDGKLATGTWQGIWYLEFRAHKHSRKLVATIQGEKM